MPCELRSGQRWSGGIRANGAVPVLLFSSDTFALTFCQIMLELNNVIARPSGVEMLACVAQVESIRQRRCSCFGVPNPGRQGGGGQQASYAPRCCHTPRDATEEQSIREGVLPFERRELSDNLFNRCDISQIDIDVEQVDFVHDLA